MLILAIIVAIIWGIFSLFMSPIVTMFISMCPKTIDYIGGFILLLTPGVVLVPYALNYSGLVFNGMAI